MADCAVQTSKIHFTKIQNSNTFASSMEEKAYSTDWQLSALYDELQFKKEPKKQLFPEQTEDCGNQVEEK